MGEFVDKVKGAANEIAGKAKQAIGEQSDRPDMIAEGKAQETKGTGQKAAGSIKGALGDDV